MTLESNVAFVVELLALALAVGLVAQRIGVPYVVALLLVSLPFPHPQMAAFSAQIFFIFLPALIFEAAWNFDVAAFRRTWKPIVLLAVPGAVFTTLAIGFGLAWAALLPLQTALLLGSIVSATDAIAVIATVRQTNVPGDLATIVEGESLFNDGVAVVLYTAIVASITGSGFSLADVGLRSLVVTLGGAAIGLGGGIAVAATLRWTRDVMLTIVATVVAAYGVFLAADHLHMSGVFAALTTGIVLRAILRRSHGKPLQLEVDQFWSVLAFFANTLVFLLLGLRIESSRLFNEPVLVLSALGLTLGARALFVYGALPPFLPPERRTHRLHVMAIAGMRGALSLALAVLLPDTIPHRAELIDCVFVIVTATLVVQGLAIAPLIRRLTL